MVGNRLLDPTDAIAGKYQIRRRRLPVWKTGLRTHSHKPLPHQIRRQEQIPVWQRFQKFDRTHLDSMLLALSLADQVDSKLIPFRPPDPDDGNRLAEDSGRKRKRQLLLSRILQRRVLPTVAISIDRRFRKCLAHRVLKKRFVPSDFRRLLAGFGHLSIAYFRESWGGSLAASRRC